MIEKRNPGALASATAVGESGQAKAARVSHWRPIGQIVTALAFAVCAREAGDD